MYRISDEKIISTDTEHGITTVDATLIVSSTSALPAFNAIPGRRLVPGSVALIPSEGAFYMLDTDNTWKWGSDD